jgi:hypothetical protein
MGFPWSKVLGGVKAGATLGSLVGVPYASEIVKGIHAAEKIPGLKGPQKKEAAKAIAAELIGEDGMLTRDGELARLSDAFIDAYVALVNRIAVLHGAGA